MQEQVVERRKDAGLGASRIKVPICENSSLLPEELEQIRRNNPFVGNVQPDDVQRVKLIVTPLQMSQAI